MELHRSRARYSGNNAFSAEHILSIVLENRMQEEKGSRKTSCGSGFPVEKPFFVFTKFQFLKLEAVRKRYFFKVRM